MGVAVGLFGVSSRAAAAVGVGRGVMDFEFKGSVAVTRGSCT